VSKRTYVCFDCRTTERVPVGRISRSCRKCRKQAEHVFYKFKIPKRTDDAAWQELETKVRAFNRNVKTDALVRLRQERTRLERLIAELPESKPDRRRVLSFKLKRITADMKEWTQW
jgi:hypothetical protein